MEIGRRALCLYDPYACYSWTSACLEHLERNRDRFVARLWSQDLRVPAWILIIRFQVLTDFQVCVLASRSDVVFRRLQADHGGRVLRDLQLMEKCTKDRSFHLYLTLCPGALE